MAEERLFSVVGIAKRERKDGNDLGVTEGYLVEHFLAASWEAATNACKNLVERNYPESEGWSHLLYAGEVPKGLMQKCVASYGTVSASGPFGSQ